MQLCHVVDHLLLTVLEAVCQDAGYRNHLDEGAEHSWRIKGYKHCELDGRDRREWQYARLYKYYNHNVDEIKRLTDLLAQDRRIQEALSEIAEDWAEKVLGVVLTAPQCVDQKE